MTDYAQMDSPIGPLLLTGNAQGLNGIYMRSPRHPAQPDADWQERPERFQAAMLQLQEYFKGQRRNFDLPTAPEGTPFQKKVWQALLQIPYGHTWSYGQLAAHIGQPKASRAVGLANGRNPLSIIVPCHRVIGANGQLTGYGGGIERKRWLLVHEAETLGI